jgi:hypothetical protein
VCQTSPNIVTVEFLNQFGYQSPLVAVADATMTNSGGYVDISADGSTVFSDNNNRQLVSVKGSKENDVCSSRGLCDYSEGTCACYDTNGDAYSSSDGYGKSGDRGDCGYVSSALDSAISSCPGELQCSAHGVCSESTYRCDCYDGWTSGDCSERSCPYDRSWFDYPATDNVAHMTYAECSGMGTCNRVTGVCVCRQGFYGSACELMTCNGAIVGDHAVKQCTGHGRCMPMAELATWATSNGDATDYRYGEDPNNALTWDAHRIHGCLCDDGYEGFDCSLRSCPRGDDPGTYDDHSEIQFLRCVADEGYFTVSFRQATSSPIMHNATRLEFLEELKKLPTLASNIEVYFTHDSLPSNKTLSLMLAEILVDNANATGIGFDGSSVCNSTDKTQLVIIDFAATYGDVPKLQIDTDYLNLASTGDHGIITVYADSESAETTDRWQRSYSFTSLKGSTENDVCNNRGICDYSSGRCQCFEQYSSSDGEGGPGVLGDCGYRIEHLAAAKH